MYKRKIFNLLVTLCITFSMLGGSVAHALIPHDTSLVFSKPTKVGQRQAHKPAQQTIQTDDQLFFVDAQQVSTKDDGVATRAIDGNTDGDWTNGSVTQTDQNADNWWQGDLEASARIDTIKIYNRTDCCSGRLQNFYILVSDVDLRGKTLKKAKKKANIYQFEASAVSTSGAYTWDLPGGVRGRYIMIYKEANKKLSLAEVEVFGEYSPMSADITLTADNNYKLFLNGQKIGEGSDWTTAETFSKLPLRRGENVFAIKATNNGHDAGVVADITIEGHRLMTNRQWKVSTLAPSEWKDVDFNDRRWASATQYGRYGSASPWHDDNPNIGLPSDTKARWIWSSDGMSDDTVYLRYTFDTDSYRYYRFTPTELRNNNVSGVQLAELTFYDDDGKRLKGATVTNPGGNTPDTKKPENANDWNVDTKWFDQEKKALVYDFDHPVNADSYSFTTADNHEGRDPIRWLVEGSHDAQNWSLLDDKSYADQNVPTARQQKITPISLDILMDHPPKGGAGYAAMSFGEQAPTVLFVGDAEHGRLRPGEQIKDEGPGAYLKYTNDGNLELYGDYNVLLWKSSNTSISLSTECDHHARVDPDYGLAVFHCNDKTPVWSALPEQAEHTNFHLRLSLGSLLLYDMDNKKMVWSVIGNQENKHYEDPNNPTVDQEFIRVLWTQQGWTHHENWDDATTDKFIDLFSHNPTDPHTDAHRMLASIHAYDQHNGVQRNLIGPLVETEIIHCIIHCINWVEATAELIDFVDQYAYMMDKIVTNMSFDNGDPVADDIFSAIFTEDAMTDLVPIYNHLLTRAPNSTMTNDNTNLLNNGWTQFLGEHPHRGDEFRIEASLNLGKIWDILSKSNNIKFLEGTTPIKTVLDLEMAYVLTIPKYDPNTETATYTHKLRTGLFDGISADGKELSKKFVSSNFLVGGIAGLFSGQGGFYGTHEWLWEVTRNAGDNNYGEITNVDVSYKYTLGGLVEAGADASATITAWETLDTYTSYFRNVADTTDAYEKGMDLFRAPFAQAVSNDSFSQISGLESNMQSSLEALSSQSSDDFSTQQAKIYARHLTDLMTNQGNADNATLLTLLIEKDLYKVTGGSSFQMDTSTELRDVVTLGPNGIVYYEGKGGNQTFNVSPLLYNRIRSTYLNSPDEYIGESIASWVWQGDTSQLDNATAWVTQLGFQMFVTHANANNLLPSTFKVGTGAEYSIIVEDWDTLTNEQRYIILFSGFGGNVVAGTFFTAVFWEVLSVPLARQSIATEAEIGGLLGVSLAVAALNIPSKTEAQMSGCMVSAVKPGGNFLISLPQYIVPSQSSAGSLYDMIFESVTGVTYGVWFSTCSENLLND